MTFENVSNQETASPIEYADTNTPIIDGCLRRLEYAQSLPEGSLIKEYSIIRLLQELKQCLGDILEEAIRTNETMRAKRTGGISLDIAIAVNKQFETAASPLDAISHVLNFRDAVAASRRPGVEEEQERVTERMRGVVTSVDPEQIKRMTRSSGRDTGPRGKIAVARI